MQDDRRRAGRRATRPAGLARAARSPTPTRPISTPTRSTPRASLRPSRTSTGSAAPKTRADLARAVRHARLSRRRSAIGVSIDAKNAERQRALRRRRRPRPARPRLLPGRQRAQPRDPRQVQGIPDVPARQGRLCRSQGGTAERCLRLEKQIAAQIAWDRAARRAIRDLTYNRDDRRPSSTALVGRLSGRRDASGAPASATRTEHHRRADCRRPRRRSPKPGSTPEQLRQAGRRDAGDADAARTPTPIADTAGVDGRAVPRRRNAAVLPSDIDDANFAFYGKTLQRPAPQQRPRWQRAIGVGRGRDRRARSGKVYVERHFPAASKAAMDELVGNLRARDGRQPQGPRVDERRQRGSQRRGQARRVRPSRSATRTSSRPTTGLPIIPGQRARQRIAVERLGAGRTSSADLREPVDTAEVAA